MSAAARADGNENSIADLDRTKRTVTASYTRDHRAPTAALMKPPLGWWRWIVKIARASLRMREDRNPLDPQTDHKLPTGRAKRMYLKNGARILCRRGKVWITLDEGGEDIVLGPSEGRNFGPGTRLLVEALMASRISVKGS